MTVRATTEFSGCVRHVTGVKAHAPPHRHITRRCRLIGPDKKKQDLGGAIDVLSALVIRQEIHVS